MPLFPLERDQAAQLAVEELAAADERELGIGFLGEIRVHALRGAREVWFGGIERPARHDTHGADAAFGHVGGRCLHDFDARHEFDRQIAEVDGAIAGGHGQRQRRDAVHFDANQVGLGAAHADAAALAVLARDLYAGDALERFAEILVGEIADVFGGDRVDDLRRVFLEFECVAQACANTGDDDFIDLFGGLGVLRER